MACSDESGTPPDQVSVPLIHGSALLSRTDDLPGQYVTAGRQPAKRLRVPGITFGPRQVRNTIRQESIIDHDVPACTNQSSQVCNSLLMVP